MFKKAAAIILCAAMAVPTVNAYAEQPVQTEAIVREYAASAKEWDGKTALTAGKSYTVSGKVTISKSVTIPSGTTLTVAKGGKLTVSSKGTLNVKGTLNIKSGATMTVNGKLKLYSGKKLTVGGTLKFGKSSTVSLSGKTTISAFGIITGEPKTVTAGSKATLKADGVIDSTKIAKAFKKTSDSKQAKAIVTDVTEAVFVKGEISGLFKTVFPKGVYEELEKEFDAEEMGCTLDEALDSISQFIAAMMASESGALPTGVDTSKLTVKFIGKSELPAAEESLAQYYKNITAAAVVNGNYALTYENNNNDFMDAEIVEAYIVKIDGVWYMYVGSGSDLM